MTNSKMFPTFQTHLTYICKMNYSELFFEKHKGDDMDFFVELIYRFQQQGVQFELEESGGAIRLLIKK